MWLQKKPTLIYEIKDECNSGIWTTKVANQ